MLAASCGDKKTRVTPPPTPSPETREASADETSWSAQVFRDSRTDLLSLQQEKKLLNQGGLSSEGYRVAPRIEEDDEGAIGSKTRVKTVPGRPLLPCGSLEKATDAEESDEIQRKTQHCARINGVSATWSAKDYGIRGESDWKLLGIDPNGVETWRQQQSGYLWHGPLPAVTGTEALDAEKVCQSIGQDLEGLAHWRLPSRADFLRGDVLGLRAVFGQQSQRQVWTATPYSKDRSQLWVYDLNEGRTSTLSIDGASASVICLGVSRIP